MNHSPVPLLDLKRQYQQIRGEVEEVLRRVCDAQQFIMGPEVEAFEREIAAYCGTRFAVGVSSGTDAILLALMALGIGPGDEVLTSAYSFFATAGSVARVGATPVFVDIDPATFNLDPRQVAARITSRTKAIMPVHLFGQCAEMEPLLEAAQRHGVPMIEDAAQAIGAEYRGQRAGSFGSCGCFSFFPSKNLGGFGDGGLVTTNDEALAQRLRLLRVHGAREKYFHEEVGGNFRLDALQAAVLRVKLRYLDGWTAGRQRNAAAYRELLGAAAQRATVGLPVEGPQRRHIYNQFVVRVPQRDTVLQRLRDRGIGAEVYYPVPLHLQQCFRALGVRRGTLPHSEQAAADSLAIPIFAELSGPELERVAAVLTEAVS